MNCFNHNKRGITVLKDQVKEIALNVSTGVLVEADEVEMYDSQYAEGEMLAGYDWLRDAMEFRWLINSDGLLIEGQALVAFGGPNIWVNIECRGRVEVRGYWWGESETAIEIGDPMGVFEAMNEIYNLQRG